MKEKLTDNTRFLAGLMAAIIAVFYTPMFINLYNWWDKDPNYGHALFIPLASAFLIWQKRKVLKEIPQEPCQGVGIFLFAVGLLMYVVGSRIEMFRLCIISFLIVAFAFVFFFYGKRMARKLLFPIGFMIFMIPIPRLDDLTAPLKLLASKASAGFLSLIRLSVYREGNIIYLPNFTLEVATVCSGLKSLVLIATLSVFYGYIVLPRVLQRVVLFLFSIPIAILANIARIIAVGWLSELVGARVLFQIVHDFSGVFVFIIAGALLALTARMIEKCKFLKSSTG